MQVRGEAIKGLTAVRWIFYAELESEILVTNICNRMQLENFEKRIIERNQIPDGGSEYCREYLHAPKILSYSLDLC